MRVAHDAAAERHVGIVGGAPPLLAQCYALSFFLVEIPWLAILVLTVTTPMYFMVRRLLGVWLE